MSDWIEKGGCGLVAVTTVSWQVLHREGQGGLRDVQCSEDSRLQKFTYQLRTTADACAQKGGCGFDRIEVGVALIGLRWVWL